MSHNPEIISDLLFLFSTRSRSLQSVYYGQSVPHLLLSHKGKKVCGILTEAVTDFESGNIEFVIAAAIIFAGIYILTRKKDALDEEQPDSFTEEEHYWTPYRPYQQNLFSEIPGFCCLRYP